MILGTLFSFIRRTLSLSVKSKKIVLVGGGHAQLQVIKAFNKAARPKHWNVTLIDKNDKASYSGMVPGCVAKLYSKVESQIDLVGLATWAGVEFCQSSVVDMHPESNQIILENGNVIDYDVLSVDIGSTVRGLKDVFGAREHAIATRPIDLLVEKVEEKISSLENSTQKPNKIHIVVVGGGAAGIELSFTIKARFEKAINQVFVTVLNAGDEVFHEESKSCKDAMLKLLKEKEIHVKNRCRVQSITENHIILESGERIQYDSCLWAAGAAAHESVYTWKSNGLSVSRDGWIQVTDGLQSISHRNIFAAGDCSTIEFKDGRKSPPKSGVYAVRSGPILIENISRFLNEETLIAYSPQDDFLKLFTCGDGTAIGFRFGIAFRGPWVFQLKDRIDKMFMALFQVDLLPPLDTFKEGQYDTAQYDAHELPHEKMNPYEAACILQRTDDDVDFQQAWFVLRNMMSDTLYKDLILKEFKNTNIS